MLRPLVPLILSNPIGRTISLYPYFGRAWAVSAEDAIDTFRYGSEAPAFEPAVDWLFSHRPEGLGEIRCPVTILWGTRDALLFPRQGPRWARAIPGAELRPLPGLGHTPFFDDPGMMTRVILDASEPASRTTRASRFQIAQEESALAAARLEVGEHRDRHPALGLGPVLGREAAVEPVVADDPPAAGAVGEDPAAVALLAERSRTRRHAA